MEGISFISDLIEKSNKEVLEMLGIDITNDYQWLLNFYIKFINIIIHYFKIPAIYLLPSRGLFNPLYI